MKYLIRLLISSLLVMIITQLMKKVIAVDNFLVAVQVALVLSVLNLVVKPILVLLTLPVTFFTLGFFLLIINAVILYICSYIVDGFRIYSFLSAMIFSVLLSISQSITYKLTERGK